MSSCMFSSKFLQFFRRKISHIMSHTWHSGGALLRRNMVSFWKQQTNGVLSDPDVEQNNRPDETVNS